jgi:hypothetical protein
MQARPRAKQPRHWLLWWGVRLLPVVSVMVGGWAGFHWWATSQLAEAVAAVDAEDPNWRLRDIEAARTVIPDDQNGALLVVKAAGTLPDTYRSEIQPRLFRLQGRTRPVERLPEQDVVILRQALSQLQPVLVDARRFADRPRGCFPLVFSPDWWHTVGNDLDAVREMESLLWYDIDLRAEARDLDRALQSCRALAAAGRSLGDSPYYGCQRRRLGTGLAAARYAAIVLGQGPVGDRELAALQHLFEDEEQHPGLEIGLRGERAGYHCLLEFIESGRAVPAEYACPTPRITLWNRISAVYERESLKLEHARFLRDMTARCLAARTPWEARVGPFEQGCLGMEIDIPPLEEQLRWPCSQAESYFHRGHAQLRCAAAMLAAERFRIAHDRWPNSTAELASPFLKQPPIDPYLGGPLGLRKTVDGIIIYSKGPDCRDDDGDIEGPQGGGAPRDIGFRLWNVDQRRQPPTPRKPE